MTMLKAAAKKIEAHESTVEEDDAHPVSETRIRIRKNDVVRAMADALEDILRAERSND